MNEVLFLFWTAGQSYGEDVSWMDSTEQEVNVWTSMIENPNHWVDATLPIRTNLTHRSEWLSDAQWRTKHTLTCKKRSDWKNSLHKSTFNVFVTMIHTYTWLFLQTHGDSSVAILWTNGVDQKYPNCPCFKCLICILFPYLTKGHL